MTPQVNFDNIPEAIVPGKRWVLWTEENGAKVPKQLNGYRAKSTVSTTWSNFDDVKKVYEASSTQFSGIGKVLDPATRRIYFDLDDIYDNNGDMYPWANALIKTLDSYTEITPSRQGVRVIVEGDWPKALDNKASQQEGKSKLEVFVGHSPRYMCVTGDRLEGTPGEIRSISKDAVLELVEQFYAPRTYSERDELLEEAIEVMIDVWAEGSRHFRAKDFAGAMKSAGFSKDEAIEAIRTSATEADDAEVNDRVACVQTTYAKANDETTTGLPTLARYSPGAAKLLGKAKRLSEGVGEGEADLTSLEQAIAKLTPPDEAINDQSLADLILLEFGDRMSLIQGDEKGEVGWCFFDDNKGWAYPDKAASKRIGLFVKDVANALGSLSMKVSSRDQKDYAHKYAWYVRAYTQKALREMVTTYIHDPQYGAVSYLKEWDDPLFLGTREGVVSLTSGELHPHAPSVHIYKRTNGVIGKPDDTDRVWREFLKEIISDPEVLEYLRWVMGRAMFGAGKDESLYFIIGNSGTGKSTFLEGIDNALGSYSVNLPSAILFEREKETKSATPVKRSLFGARFAYIEETPSGKINVATVKQLTGGSSIAARGLNEGIVKFSPTHSLFVATNEYPKMDVDDAIVRRWVTLRFDTKLSKIEPARLRKVLLTKRREGADAILRWLVEAAAEHRDNLKPPGGVPKIVEQWSAAILRESDRFVQYVDDRLEREAGSFIPTAHLYQDFRQWTEERRYADLESITETKFSSQLAKKLPDIAKGKRTIKGKQVRGYVGLKWKDERDG